MSDYIAQLEQQNEELKDKLTVAENLLSERVPVEWRRMPLNENRQDLYFGKSRHFIATLVHTSMDIHKKGCYWQLSFIRGDNSFHITEEDAKRYALLVLQ